MSYSDKLIKCTMCGAEFTFTAGEQQIYATKNLGTGPKRCHICRKIKKPERSSSNGNSDRYSGLSLGAGH